MVTVKFNESGIGRWAESDTLTPQFVIEEADQTHRCSDELAEIIVASNKGAIVEDDTDEDAAATEELAKVEELKGQALELIAELKLDVNDYNLGVDSEGLTGLVTNLTTMKEESVAEASKRLELIDQIIPLVALLGLDPESVNVDQGSEKLTALLADLTTQQEAKQNEAAEAKKAKKTPASKDKKKAESK